MYSVVLLNHLVGRRHQTSRKESIWDQNWRWEFRFKVVKKIKKGIFLWKKLFEASLYLIFPFTFVFVLLYLHKTLLTNSVSSFINTRSCYTNQISWQKKKWKGVNKIACRNWDHVKPGSVGKAPFSTKSATIPIIYSACSKESLHLEIDMVNTFWSTIQMDRLYS